MRIAAPIVIDIHNPGKTWSYKNGKGKKRLALQAEIEKGHVRELAEVRESMKNPATHFGWRYSFRSIKVDKERPRRPVIETDLEVICIFNHPQPVFMEAKILTSLENPDESGESIRILLRGRERWFELTEYESLIKMGFHVSGNNKIDQVIFVIKNKKTGRSLTHTVSRNQICIER